MFLLFLHLNPCSFSHFSLSRLYYYSLCFPRQEFAFVILAVLPDRHVVFVRVLDDIHISCSCTSLFPWSVFLSLKRGFFWLWLQVETSSPLLSLSRFLLFSYRLLCCSLRLELSHVFNSLYSFHFFAATLFFLLSQIHSFSLRFASSASLDF